MTTTTIRVDDAVRARVAERANAEGKPMSQVIDEALDAQADREFWDEVRRTMTSSDAKESLARDAEELTGEYLELLEESEDWSHLL